MHPVQEQVIEFHQAGGHTINTSPTLVDEKTRKLRERLIREEVLEELFPAMERGDIVEIADALADTLYVVLRNSYLLWNRYGAYQRRNTSQQHD